MSSYEEGSRHIIRNVILPFYENVPEACWTAEFFKGNNKKESRWIIKAINSEYKEFSFKLTSLGDINNENFWSAFTSIDFALELITNFKKGHNTLESWLNQKVQLFFPNDKVKKSKTKKVVKKKVKKITKKKKLKNNKVLVKSKKTKVKKKKKKMA